MKISNSSEIAKYVDKSILNGPKKSTETSPKSGEIPLENNGDTIVNLSQSSKDVQKIHGAIASEPDLRQDKVNAIKEKIENGTYEIDFDKTAEKMIKSFFDDMA